MHSDSRGCLTSVFARSNHGPLSVLAYAREWFFKIHSADLVDSPPVVWPPVLFGQCDYPDLPPTASYTLGPWTHPPTFSCGEAIGSTGNPRLSLCWAVFRQAINETRASSAVGNQRETPT